MDNKRPQGRETNVTGNGGQINKRGAGLGTGPVGANKEGYKNRPTASNSNTAQSSKPLGSSSSQRSITRSGGRLGLILAVIVLLFLCRKSLFGGLDTTLGSNVVTGQSDLGSSVGVSSLLNMLSSSVEYTTSESDYSSYAASASTNTKLNRKVASGSREKRTEILGGGKDTVTIMVYMCGTDLESQYGMGTADLSEMCAADLSDKINLIVYTGGCSQWKTSGISNKVNQIYKINNGSLTCLEKDMGSVAMTKPETLSEFIKYCTKNYPANRQALILWDHGSGSISGYGYDEKNQSAGSMTLAGINKALKNGGTTFDFIGFDACLMATVENALMLADYADYMIASEETEPGVGWYYTNWLNKLSANTSMETLDIGKNIVDDFVDVCDKKCNGQKTTLSLIDLAELENTVPPALTEFAKSTNNLIKNDEYKTVSDARYATKEFAQSSKIDQIDLVHFAKNLNTTESKALADALQEAVKYNRTASCVSNAYGMSIYFPYKKANKVDQVVSTYDAIGMDAEYARCIQEFASLEVSGQVSQGGTNSALSSLLGNYSNITSGSSGGSVDTILNMLSGLSSGSQGFEASGLSTLAMSFLTGRQMSNDKAAAYLADNYFDASKLVWQKNANGKDAIMLSDKQWGLIEGVDLNVFIDDGEGYIDLGLDNVFEFDNDGNLLSSYDNSWVAINNQVVAYYHTGSDNGVFTGYVPAMLNGDRVELLVVFDENSKESYVSGARKVYTNNETETVAKSLIALKKGDKLDFVCDYYNYDGTYQDSYKLGNTMTLSDTLYVSNVDISANKVNATFLFTDIYNQQYWTPVIP